MKKLYLFFNVFLTLFIFSCSTQIIRNQVNGSVIQKELTKYINVTWKLNPKYLTDLPAKIKDELIKSCGSNKFILVKVSTIDFDNTKGTFRCN